MPREFGKNVGRKLVLNGHLYFLTCFHPSK